VSIHVNGYLRPILNLLNHMMIGAPESAYKTGIALARWRLLNWAGRY